MKPAASPDRFARMRSPLVALLVPALMLPALVHAKPAPGPSREEQDLAKKLAGRTPGTPTNCLLGQDRLDSETIPGVGILYKRGRTYWLNRFENGCTGMGPFDIVVTVSPSSQVCRGDMVHIVDQTTHVLHGACSIGSFVPYTLPKK